MPAADSVALGRDVRIFHPTLVNLYGCRIGNETKEGSFLPQLLVSYRTGDIWAPKIDAAEALQVEAQHFVRCVDTRETPITDDETGWRVVRLLEAASAPMAARGRPVSLLSGEYV